MPTYTCAECGAQSSDPDDFVNRRALMSNAETAMPADVVCSDAADCTPHPTECGHPGDAYDTPGDYRVNGHYHYASGACDLEPPYSQGGPA